MSESNQYDCPHCGAEDIGMYGHNCQESILNTQRRQAGLEEIHVDTRFSRHIKCPNCAHEFRT